MVQRLHRTAKQVLASVIGRNIRLLQQQQQQYSGSTDKKIAELFRCCDDR